MFFWRKKTSTDNDWHPRPGADPVQYNDRLPAWIKRQDFEAMTVDCAPFVAGAGGLAHLGQLNKLGWTAPASIFRNRTTMMAMHRTVLCLTPLILLCQALGLEYRNFIPRWSHDRERRRDEEQVRHHVQFGMGAGVLMWAARMYFLRLGTAYWTPIDAIMGGALADLAHREYVKAHGL